MPSVINRPAVSNSFFTSVGMLYVLGSANLSLIRSSIPSMSRFCVSVPHTLSVVVALLSLSSAMTALDSLVSGIWIQPSLSDLGAFFVSNLIISDDFRDIFRLLYLGAVLAISSIAASCPAAGDARLPGILKAVFLMSFGPYHMAPIASSSPSTLV